MGERLTYFTIAASLFTYLTDVMHQGVSTSAENVNIWSGVTTIVPLIGGFLSDAYVGRYKMIIISSLVYLPGLAFLIVSVSLSSLRPPTNTNNHATGTQMAVLYASLYMISFGSGAMKPSLQSFAADQFDYQHPKESKQQISFFNWYYFCLMFAILMTNTVIVYVQGNVSWGAGFGIVASASLISILIFLCGTPKYRHRVPVGSPITRIAQVLVAAFRNRHLQVKLGHSHTGDFKCLEKAAIGEELEHGRNNPWKTCTGEQVEEVKQLARMVPVWLTVIIYSTILQQGGTFFVKQSSTMDRSLGPHFHIPPASTLAVVIISTMITVGAYDRMLVPIAARITGMKRGITILQRIGVGFVFSIVATITAALVEARRLKIAQDHGLMHKPQAVVPMSAFWLSVPNVGMGIADAFALVGLQEFFYGQVPDTMRSLGLACLLTAIGIGSFVSSLIIHIVNGVTGKMGHKWLKDNLNTSRLDNFYWLLVALNSLNLLAFVFIARRYKYKSRPQDETLVAKVAESFSEEGLALT
ncbi:protein NRT1/ PTR FAMILY 5.4 isoform X2 [Cryptomeria japonica]|nr:protein NRT1/ PTR FAMILY 5.4 isoform X2 [Cryptomeria japonica]XP_057814977.2 protein NRT1/ PTR FAMILY 5.4 isoform X2 [Cryptomeria japonica]